MLTFIGWLLGFAGLYSFARGCWLGGLSLFGWMVPTLVYTVTAIAIFECGI